MLLLILLIIGLFGGILAGMLGVGGGIIFTPVLFFLFDGKVDDPVAWTIGTSLLCTFFAALGSIRKQAALNNLFIKESLKVAVFGVLGTTIGKVIVSSDFYSRTEFLIFFSILVAYSGYKFFSNKSVGVSEDVYDPQNTKQLLWFHAFIVGAIGGIIATLGGVGGGIVMVPLMALFMGIQFKKAVSISSFTIVFISLSGWFQFSLDSPGESGLTSLTAGFVDFGTAAPLIIGALIGSGTGVYLLNRIKKRPLELLYSAFLLIVLIKMLWDLF